MTTARILAGTDADRASWTAYVRSHPQATIDHCWEWKLILETAFGFKPYYLAAYEQERLSGILPLFHVPRGFGRSALVSIPYGNYGGVCADSPAAAAALLAEADRLMRRLRCSHVALHHRQPLVNAGLFDACDKSRFSRPVAGTPEELFSGLGKTARKKVRYSIRNGLTTGVSQDTSALYRIHTAKFRRLGTPCFPRLYFDLTLRNFGDRAQILYAYYRNEPVAFNLLLFFGSSMLVTVSGDIERYRVLHPNILIYWHELTIASERGCTELDMCRSTRNSGPAQNKLMLGLAESPLGYQYLVPDGRAVSSRSPNAGAFKVAAALWRRIPLPCTRAIGPRLVRYFA